jgi:hypothetical protein
VARSANTMQIRLREICAWYIIEALHKYRGLDCSGIESLRYGFALEIETLK